MNKPNKSPILTTIVPLCGQKPSGMGRAQADTMNRRILLLITAALVSLPMLATLTACAPATRYRRTALVPMPTGDSLTQPQEGVVDLSGSVSHQHVPQELFPAVGDPALQAAQTTVSGQARVRLGPYFRLGAQGFYSNASMAEATAVGTPPMDGQNVYGIGPNVSFNYRAEKWAVGGGLSLTFASVPWATWGRTDGRTSTTYEPSESFLAQYAYQDGGRESMLLFNFAAGATYIPNPYVQLFGGFSVQNSLENIGFDDQQRDGSTLTGTNVGVVPFVGITGRTPVGVYLRAQYFVPLGYGQFNGELMNAGGFMATLGWDIETSESSSNAKPVPGAL